jgi:hypothetical protein
MARSAEPEPEAPPALPPPRRRRLGADPSGRRFGVIAGGIGAGLLLIVGAWVVRGHHHGAIPVVQAPSGPMRVKPENRGGMQVSGMNDPILSGDFGKGQAALAPPPETPEPKALRTQLQAEKRVTAPRLRAEQALAPRAQKAAVPLPPTPPAVALAPGPEAPLPRPGVASPGLAGPGGAKPARVPAPAATPQAPAAAPAGPGPGSANAATVQFVAVRSEAAARAEWTRMANRMPALLSGRQPSFTRISRDGHVFWRLRTGGFAGRQAASRFCARVRAKGGTCVVSDF